MLHILLLLLKVLGIFLLVVFGIFLLLALLVLFTPVRYRGNVSFHGEAKGTVFVSWLFCILRIRLVLDESLKLSVKVLWHKLFEEVLWSKEEDEKKELFGDDGSQKDLPGTEVFPESSSEGGRFGEEIFEEGLSGGESFGKEIFEEGFSGGESFGEEISEEGFGEVLPDFEEEELEMVHMAELSGGERKEEQEPGAESGLEENSVPKKILGPEEKRSRKEKPALGERLCRLCKKIKEFILGGRSSLKKVRKKYEGVMAFIGDEENQKTFRLLTKQIKKLFKCILPGNVKGRIRFGFEDPYDTGKVLTIISPFYGLYARTLAVEPVFGEKALEGELKIKGKIRAASLLSVGLRLFMNKNFRRLLKRWR